MGKNSKDILVIRELAKKYAEIANKPVQEEKRNLWLAHNALKKTRVPVLATFGMWNVWAKELLADKNLQCEDEFFRGYEKFFKLSFIQDEIGDDSPVNPWITLYPTRVEGEWENHWGISRRMTKSAEAGGAFHLDAMINDWSEFSKFRAMRHGFDEVDTKKKHELLFEAVGKSIEIDICRDPIYTGFQGDISTDLANVRGLQQMMMDMYEYPAEMHKLLAFMRDSILKNHQDAEDAGHLTLTCNHNQQPCYMEGLQKLAPNSKPVKRKDLTTFFAAQEFTLVSPDFHYEFLLQYQIPIMGNYAFSHYGCCEDLTKKIDMLRKVKNLRTIAVTPVADVKKCAEQIGNDYVSSYRPNPTDMVAHDWDETRIKGIIGGAKRAFIENNCIWHVHLKDIETLGGDLAKMGKWVRLVKQIVND